MTADSFITNQIDALGLEYREFVESDFATEAAGTFAESLNLQGRATEVLENTIFLYLLMIFSREDAVDFITRNCDLPPSEAATLWNAIEATLPEGLQSLIEATRNTVNETAPDSQQLASEIAETEDALSSLQGIRTMAADMQSVAPAAHAEQVHTSSQEEILTPKAAFGGQQRWDTEA